MHHTLLGQASVCRRGGRATGVADPAIALDVAHQEAEEGRGGLGGEHELLLRRGARDEARCAKNMNKKHRMRERSRRLSGAGSAQYLAYS